MDHNFHAYQQHDRYRCDLGQRNTRIFAFDRALYGIDTIAKSIISGSVHDLDTASKRKTPKRIDADGSSVSKVPVMLGLPLQPHQASHKKERGERSNTISIGLRRYPVLRSLGSGGFSDVFLVKRPSGAQQAIKRVKGTRPSVASDPAKCGIPCLMEASIMSSYVHPNLVTSSRIMGHNHTLYIFQEVAICDLDTWRTRMHPTCEAVQVLFYSVLRALSYLHSEGIIHADVKDQNILVYGENDFRLGDGSLACFDAWPRNHLPNTASYRPPEGWPWLAERDAAFGGSDFVWDSRVDIFALGCTIYRVIFDHQLFYSQPRTPSGANTNANRHKRCINALLDWYSFYYGENQEECPPLNYYPIDHEEPYIDERMCGASRRDDLVALMWAALHPNVHSRPSVDVLLMHPMFDMLNKGSLHGHRRIPRNVDMIYGEDDGVADVAGMEDSDAARSELVVSGHLSKANTVEEAVNLLAKRIRARYEAVIAASPSPQSDDRLLQITIVWIARKMLRVKGGMKTLGILPSQWNDIYRLEEQVLHTIDYMIH